MGAALDMLGNLMLDVCEVLRLSVNIGRHWQNARLSGSRSSYNWNLLITRDSLTALGRRRSQGESRIDSGMSMENLKSSNGEVNSTYLYS